MLCLQKESGFSSMFSSVIFVWPSHGWLKSFSAAHLLPGDFLKFTAHGVRGLSLEIENNGKGQTWGQVWVLQAIYGTRKNLLLSEAARPPSARTALGPFPFMSTVENAKCFQKRPQEAYLFFLLRLFPNSFTHTHTHTADPHTLYISLQFFLFNFLSSFSIPSLSFNNNHWI